MLYLGLLTEARGGGPSPTVNIDLRKMLSAEIVDYPCAERSSCFLCTKSDKCAWCVDEGMCITYSDIDAACPRDTLMDWQLNARTFKNPIECIGAPTHDLDAIEIHEMQPTAICEGKPDFFCNMKLPYYPADDECKTFTYEDQTYLKDVFKWIRSVMCAIHGIHSYQDIYKTFQGFHWQDAYGSDINWETLITALNDGIWTTQTLPEEYCQVMDCCNDESYGALSMDQYRLMPNLAHCEDVYEDNPMQNAFCDHRLDTIRTFDHTNTIGEHDGFHLSTKRTAVKLLLQMSSLSKLGKLGYVEETSMGPFYDDKYAKISICSSVHSMESELGNPVMEEDRRVSWLQDAGFVKDVFYEQYIDNKYFLYASLIFFIFMPLIPLLILNLTSYSLRKKQFRDNESIRERLKYIESDLLRKGHHRGVTGSVTRSMIEYIKDRLDDEPLERKLALKRNVVPNQ